MARFTRSLAREVESPSAMGSGLSNTPQPKPDRGSRPVLGQGTSLNRLPSSGMPGRLDETATPSANQTSNSFSSTTFDNSSWPSVLARCFSASSSSLSFKVAKAAATVFRATPLDAPNCRANLKKDFSRGSLVSFISTEIIFLPCATPAAHASGRAPNFGHEICPFTMEITRGIKTASTSSIIETRWPSKILFGRHCSASDRVEASLRVSLVVCPDTTGSIPRPSKNDSKNPG